MASSSKPFLRAFRLCSPRWRAAALSGEGAQKYGGRWNSPGQAMVYLGSTRALTALELLAHLPTPSSRRKPFVLIEVELPITELALEKVSGNWNAQPPEKDSFEVGDKWLKSGHSLALAVPSCLIPEETCILLNPLHPKNEKVRVVSERSFSFDQRL